MDEGDTFGGILVRANCRSSSSGLNLSCEGLLSGMQSRAHKATPVQSPTLRLGPSLTSQQLSPLSFVLQGGMSPVDGETLI
jgi:hypothetical protein